MELRESRFGYTRKIQPFPERAPEVFVEMKKLSTGQVLRIYDQNGLRPGSDRNTWAKWDKANREIVLFSIVNWEGFTENEQALECTDKTKGRLVDTLVKGGEDGGKVPIWKVLQDEFEKSEEEDVKN